MNPKVVPPEASFLIAPFDAILLPFLVRMPCPFWCGQIRQRERKCRENRCFPSKVRRQYYILLVYPLFDHFTHLQIKVVYSFHLTLINSFSKLLTLLVFLPYNMLAFDPHGLIRCLERMLSGSVLTRLILLPTLEHMLSLEMGSAVGVVGLSAALNGVSLDTLES